jgi:signal transduction histidine kinase
LITSRTPEIEIKTFREAGSVVIIVRDNGMGIDLKRFGDKVFGLYNRFNLEVEGKGLGLYLVKTQVETLNGTTDIQSIPSEGTTSTILFRDQQPQGHTAQ